MLKLGFLASRSGSAMRAAIAAIEVGELAAQARIVISNRREAPALAFAAEHGIVTRVIATAVHPEAADRALAAALRDADVDLVVLCGYLRKLGPATLSMFANRILNIHPSLLPKFGGLGMYGRRVHEAVAAAGEVATGACVHIVDGDYDQGPVLASVRVPLTPGDSVEEIERKVTALEPGLMVDVLRQISQGALKLPKSDAS